MATEAMINTVSDINQEIAGIWAKLLRRDDVGGEDDFFDQGGNSMLLIAMLEEVHQRFNRGVTPDDLVEGVTINRIASLLGGQPNLEAK